MINDFYESLPDVHLTSYEYKPSGTINPSAFSKQSQSITAFRRYRRVNINEPGRRSRSGDEIRGQTCRHA